MRENKLSKFTKYQKKIYAKENKKFAFQLDILLISNDHSSNPAIMNKQKTIVSKFF